MKCVKSYVVNLLLKFKKLKIIVENGLRRVKLELALTLGINLKF